MVKFEKKIETVTLETIEVKNGIHFAKVIDSNEDRFYKFIVKDNDEFEAIIVIDDSCVKSIRYDNDAGSYTGYIFERIFGNDKGTSFIDEAEFNAHFINVMQSFFILKSQIII